MTKSMYICIYVYVCMYVYVCVCMYVCMCVCMYVCIMYVGIFSMYVCTHVLFMHYMLCMYIGINVSLISEPEFLPPIVKFRHVRII